MESNNQKLNNDLQIENQTMPSLEFEPNKKLVLIIVVVGILGGIGMYFLNQNKEVAQKSIITATPIESKNIGVSPTFTPDRALLKDGDNPGWQKYTSDDWGFEIQIPGGWEVEEKNHTKIAQMFNRGLGKKDN